MSIINNIFKKTYVINLSQSHDRLIDMKNHLDSNYITWERFDAIDGNKLSKDEIEKNTTFMCKTLCSKQMIGCALSHKKLWEKIVDEDVDNALIIEDHIVFKEGFESILENAWKELPSDWDILFLGCGGLCDKNGYQDVSSVLFNLIKPYKNNKSIKKNNIIIPELPTGLYCYAISNKGCKKLLKRINKINFHIDYQISSNHDYINIYAVYPKLINLTRAKSIINTFNFPKSINKILNMFNDSNGITYSWYMNFTLFEIGNIPFNLWSFIFIFIGFIFLKYENVKIAMFILLLIEILHGIEIKSLTFLTLYLYIGIIFSFIFKNKMFKFRIERK